MEGIFENIMKNNINVVGGIKGSTTPEEPQKRKFVEKTVVLDWLSMNSKENNKFKDMDENEEDDEDDEDEFFSSSASNSKKYNNKEDNEDNDDEEDEDEGDEEDEDDDEEDEDEDDDDEDEKGLFNKKSKEIDILSKYYCYRILIEFAHELKAQESIISSKYEGSEGSEGSELIHYVYKQYQFDEPTDTKSFKYKIHNGQIALETCLDNEFYVSFMFYLFEVIFDDKPLTFNELRQKIKDSSLDYDSNVIGCIKKMRTLDVNSWFMFIEESMGIILGDYVQFEYNHDKTMIIEKTSYEFDSMITHESVDGVKIYTIDDIIALYRSKIIQYRVLSKYH